MLKIGDRVFWNWNKDYEINLKDLQGTVQKIIFTSQGENFQKEHINYFINFDNYGGHPYPEFHTDGKRMLYKVNPNSNIYIKE